MNLYRSCASHLFYFLAMQKARLAGEAQQEGIANQSCLMLSSLFSHPPPLSVSVGIHLFVRFLFSSRKRNLRLSMNGKSARRGGQMRLQLRRLAVCDRLVFCLTENDSHCAQHPKELIELEISLSEDEYQRLQQAVQDERSGRKPFLRRGSGRLVLLPDVFFI